jgi:hypothetical protein
MACDRPRDVAVRSLPRGDVEFGLFAALLLGFALLLLLFRSMRCGLGGE